MELSTCIVPAAPVRRNASHKVEMVNQLLFGEKIIVLWEKRNWCKVQTMHDNYEGWIRNNLIAPVEDNIALTGDEFVTGDLFNIITIDGIKMNISAGCSLPGLNKQEGRIGQKGYVYRGYAIKRNDIKPNEEIVRKLTFQWLNAPYLWGGRTPLGVDCSGFVQVIFKMMGLDLLRDAKQQARQGMKVKKLGEAKTGDLAFFKKREKITHVGILLSPQQIIHASGKVRIDAIDEKGIVNKDTGKRTHSLAAIRRYW
jgi:hypothetical protein